MPNKLKVVDVDAPSESTIEVPIEVASSGSTKLALNPIARQLLIQGLSKAPASNLMFLNISIFLNLILLLIKYLAYFYKYLGTLCP